MAEWARTMRFIKSEAFKKLDWEWKRKIIFIINYPKSKCAQEGSSNDLT